MSGTDREDMRSIAYLLSQAISALSPDAAPAEVLAWLEQRSPNLALKLELEPHREPGALRAVGRALRAARHWRREGKPGPLYARLLPSARGLRAAIKH